MTVIPKHLLIKKLFSRSCMDYTHSQPFIQVQLIYNKLHICKVYNLMGFAIATRWHCELVYFLGLYFLGFYIHLRNL